MHTFGMPAHRTIAPDADNSLAALRWRTPSHWIQTASSDVCALLCDHAHLERKATSNALALLGLWPHRVELHESSDPSASTWVRTLAAIARDEAAHLATVTRELHRRGGALVPGHKNAYASELHRLVRWGRSERELLDRLLVSALIELRSYERFLLLADGIDDEALALLYRRLQQSEHGHYMQFLELAEVLAIGRDARDSRWHALCEFEGEIARSQPAGPWMHSGASTLCAPHSSKGTPRA